MTLHLLRMAVGIDDVAHLRRVQEARLDASEEGRLYTITRNTPKRASEVLDRGSLYLIIRGYVRVRQRILGIERLPDDEGRSYCRIEIDPAHISTVLQARKPQQGWRYLDPAEAPEDLKTSASGDEFPPELAAELKALGLL